MEWLSVISFQLQEGKKFESVLKLGSSEVERDVWNVRMTLTTLQTL